MSYLSRADIGGRDDERPVMPEPEEPPFHARWEARVHALTLAMGSTGAWNLDEVRSARETLADYDRLDYYRIWYAGLRRLLVARRLATAAELDDGRLRTPAPPLPRRLHAADVTATLARGASTLRERTAPARFAVGDRVRTRARAAAHHTRLPAYARGRVGVVVRTAGAHVFPDAHAHGGGEAPEYLYTVVFTALELWGSSADPAASVAIDAWEPYLEPA